MRLVSFIGLVTLGIVVIGSIPLIIHHVRRSNWASPEDIPVLAAAAK